MNKKARTIIRTSILILLIISICGISVLAQDGEPSFANILKEKDQVQITNFSSLDLVNRSLTSDTFYDKKSKEYTSRIYPKPINLKNLSGQYEPYESLTEFTFDGEAMILKWNDKVVELKVYTKDKDNKKEKINRGFIFKKNKLNFETNIQKKKGLIYYNHTLINDKKKQPKIVGYDVITKNVDCVVKNYSLVCGEQKIDFIEAVVKQNLSVKLTSSNIEISGDDLSYIDPSITIDVDDSVGDGWGEIEYDGSSTYDWDDADLSAIGSRNVPWLTRGFVLFTVDVISSSATITDVDLYLYVDGIDVTDCDDNNIDLRFYEMDEEDFDESSPDDQTDMQTIYDAINSNQDDFYGGFSNLDSGDDNSWIGKDLGYDADGELRGLLDGSPTDDFMVGIKVEPEDEDTSDDCHIDFEDTDDDPELPYIRVTYTIPDTTAPTTSISATSPPGGSPYTFDSTIANDTVQVVLSCSDGGSGCRSGYPKYCLSGKNYTCSPSITYSSPINISTGGISYIRFQSMDDFENFESFEERGIFIDRGYPQNVSLYVDGIQSWNYIDYYPDSSAPGNYFAEEEIIDLTSELNNALENCVADEEGYCDIPITIHSDSAGKINISNIDIYFNISEYIWNISGFPELSTYKTKVMATDGLLNSSWSESYSDFTIGLPNDPNKFTHKNSLGEIVAWFGDEGNIVLAGSCFSGGTCNSPGADSFIIRNSTNNNVAFINSTGDLCLVTGDCSDQSATCNPSGDAFIIQDSSINNMSYIDFDGDLCLKGSLFENYDIIDNPINTVAEAKVVVSQAFEDLNVTRTMVINDTLIGLYDFGWVPVMELHQINVTGGFCDVDLNYDYPDGSPDAWNSSEHIIVDNFNSWASNYSYMPTTIYELDQAYLPAETDIYNCVTSHIIYCTSLGVTDTREVDCP